MMRTKGSCFGFGAVLLFLISGASPALAAHGEGASWAENPMLSGCEHCHDTVIEWDTGEFRQITNRDETISVAGGMSSQTHMIVNMSVDSGRTTDIAECNRRGETCDPASEVSSLWNDVVNYMTEKEPVPLPYDELNTKTYLMNCYDGVGGSKYLDCPVGPGSVDDNCDCTGVVQPGPPVADLSVTKTGNIFWGRNVPNVDYTITVSAASLPGDAVAGNVTLSDTNSNLSSGGGTISTTQGTCSWSGSTANCFLGSMSAGDSVVITFSAALDFFTDTNTNTATVSQLYTEENLSNNEVTLTLTAPPTTSTSSSTTTTLDTTSTSSTTSTSTSTSSTTSTSTSTSSSTSTTNTTTSTTSTTTSSTTSTTSGGGITRPTIERPPRPPRPTIVRPLRPTLR